VKAPVVEQKPFTDMDLLTRKLGRSLESSKSELDSWRDRFAKNPAQALEWSQHIFDHAAEFEVASSIMYAIETLKQQGDEYVAMPDDKIIGKLWSQLYDRVMNGAKYPAHSTSVPSNEMARAILAKQAEWLGFLSDLQKKGA
jgi:predicted SAM-dependent methyltransferase